MITRVPQSPPGFDRRGKCADRKHTPKGMIKWLLRVTCLTTSIDEGGRTRQCHLASYAACHASTLTRWSRAFRTHTTFDHTRIALPVAVRSIVVRVSVRRTSARCEKGSSRSVWDTLFWVVANRAGTLIFTGVAVVEEFWWRESVRKDGKRAWMRNFRLTDIATGHRNT